MTVFDTLLAPVMPILQQIEAGRKKHHNEEFLWIDFVRILVFYFTKRCGSLNALIVALENADPALGVLAVPKMTLSDAFRRFPSTLLRQALASYPPHDSWLGGIEIGRRAGTFADAVG